MSKVVGHHRIIGKGWFVAIAALVIAVGYLVVGILPRAAAHETAAAARRSTGELAGTSTAGPPSAAAPSSEVAPSSAPAPSSVPAPGPPANAPTPAPVTGQLQAATNAAVTYATSQGWASGIAIINTQTGAATTAGSATAMFPTESTMKLFIAADLLYTGQMSGSTQDTAYQMVTESDDEDADALYATVGGDDLESTIAAHYGINDLGTPPILGSGEWGSTQVTPLGMATFLVKAKADPAVDPWLIPAMQNTAATADDGTDQDFGLKAADPAAAVKQGWGGDTADDNSEGTPSIGYVDSGLYAIAIYTNHDPQTSETVAAQVVTQQAQILMPGGILPPV
ncbi:MAG: hypothetical protein ABI137_03930 [Antricoccus sp.]